MEAISNELFLCGECHEVTLRSNSCHLITCDDNRTGKPQGKRPCLLMINIRGQRLYDNLASDWNSGAPQGVAGSSPVPSALTILYAFH